MTALRAYLSALLLVAIGAGAQAQDVSRGAGAELRGLDKLNGTITDFSVGNGGMAELGNLRVLLAECRYPMGNPSGDAYAYLSITQEGTDGAVFSGWMVASSPALNALDHPRYDIWVLRCKTE